MNIKHPNGDTYTVAPCKHKPTQHLHRAKDIWVFTRDRDGYKPHTGDVIFHELKRIAIKQLSRNKQEVLV